MAWTDITNEDSNNWPLTRRITTDTLGVDLSEDWVNKTIVGFSDVLYTREESVLRTGTLNIPGFDIGYQPASTPDPIINNIDTPCPDDGGGSGDGGSTRPTSGMIYPRGTC